MKTEEEIKKRLEEYNRRARELEVRIINDGWSRASEPLQTDLDQYNMNIALLKWVLGE